VCLATTSDLTASKRAEGRIGESESLYRSLVETTPEAIGLMDMNGTIIMFNKKALEVFGFEATDDLTGKNVMDLVAPENYQRVLDNMEILQKAETIRNLELISYKKDGQQLWLELSSSILFDDEGKPKSIITAFKDITGRKSAEEVLRDSEAQYRLLADNASDVIWTADMNMDITYISPSIYAMQGHTPAEAKNLTPEQRYTPESLESVSKRFVEAMANEAAGIVQPGDIGTYEAEYRRKDGSTYWTETKASFIRDAEGGARGILGVTRDISERRLSEEKLVKSYEATKKALGDAIYTMVKIVELRDPYTAGHQQKVADLATAIAGEMKLEDARIDQLRTAALIHDIGKMYVPSDILSKPGKLSEIELDLIKTHSKSGYDIVKGMDFPGVVALAVLQHHERLDGSGYPGQLKGEDTLLEAKILAVADVVEAMASHRPYRPALCIDKALEEISKNRGKLYDVAVADTCLELFHSGRFEFK